MSHVTHSEQNFYFYLGTKKAATSAHNSPNYDLFVLYPTYLMSARLNVNLYNILEYNKNTNVHSESKTHHTLLLLDWFSVTEPPRLFLW